MRERENSVRFPLVSPAAIRERSLPETAHVFSEPESCIRRSFCALMANYFIPICIRVSAKGMIPFVCGTSASIYIGKISVVFESSADKICSPGEPSRVENRETKRNVENRRSRCAYRLKIRQEAGRPGASTSLGSCPAVGLSG